MRVALKHEVGTRAHTAMDEACISRRNRRSQNTAILFNRQGRQESINRSEMA